MSSLSTNSSRLDLLELSEDGDQNINHGNTGKRFSCPLGFCLRLLGLWSGDVDDGETKRDLHFVAMGENQNNVFPHENQPLLQPKRQDQNSHKASPSFRVICKYKYIISKTRVTSLLNYFSLTLSHEKLKYCKIKYFHKI